jgi:hypothetical protein
VCYLREGASFCGKSLFIVLYGNNLGCLEDARVELVAGFAAPTDTRPLNPGDKRLMSHYTYFHPSRVPRSVLAGGAWQIS